MGKASRTKQAPDRRARVAAQREAARRSEQRKRIYLAGGSILAVIIVVVAFVLIKSNGSSGSGSSASNGPTGTALTSVVNQVTGVPAATLDTVGSGSGSVTGTPVKLTGNQPPLTSGGKPEMLYMGAEYCPYCAAERWGMIVALSRFGTFTGLATIHSAAKDGAGNAEVYPNTPTWTFLNANYTSNYLTFTHVEENTNIPDASNGFYTSLQTPTAAQQAIITKYDTSAYDPALGSNSGSIPFIDFGNKYMIAGASYNPQLLAGKTWAQIATALKTPSSPIAKAIDGTANYITAAICEMTGNQPASACTPAVTALEKNL
jgi:thiol-disulfide isomerase/thioredoxin